jgi:putative hydrolase of the HAD superfamily
MMASSNLISTLFLDIGGVLLSNGWDQGERVQAAEHFGLDVREMNERHHLTFDTYEEGKISLDVYLNRIVFYQERPFTREQFKTYMFDRSQAYPEMINLIKKLKDRYRLKIAAVSNEGRELTIYRVEQFQLRTFIDFFISSCFVHYRKPDQDIYRIALDVAQVQPDQVVYIDDRAMFVDVARALKIHGIIHSSLESTKKALEGFGLKLQG